MNNSCLIMMTSYNSERFLRPQLDSIINQTHASWHLIIQDDGSKDSTVEIIKEYMEKEPRIELAFNTSGKHGAFLNFHTLINRCKKREPYEYYLFCDHDDVWLPGKMERMLNEFRKLERPGRPIMVFGDMKIIDAEGNLTGESMNMLLRSECVGKNPLNDFFKHYIHGCNVMLNRALFILPPDADPAEDIVSIISHDNYYTKFAAVKGSVGFIDEPLMLYRRYGGNVTADQVYKTELKKIPMKLMKFDEWVEKLTPQFSQTLYATRQLKQIDLTEQESALVSGIESAIREGGIRAVVFCLKHHITCGKAIRTVGNYLALLSGAYKKYLLEI